MVDTIFYLSGQAGGAIPNGTRVVKVVSEEGDRHGIGSLGIVVSSHGPIPFRGKSEYGYFILWDDMPTVPILTVGFKLEQL